MATFVNLFLFSVPTKEFPINKIIVIVIPYQSSYLLLQSED